MRKQGRRVHKRGRQMQASSWLPPAQLTDHDNLLTILKICTPIAIVLLLLLLLLQVIIIRRALRPGLQGWALPMRILPGSFLLCCGLLLATATVAPFAAPLTPVGGGCIHVATAGASSSRHSSRHKELGLSAQGSPILGGGGGRRNGRDGPSWHATTGRRQAGKEDARGGCCRGHGGEQRAGRGGRGQEGGGGLSRATVALPSPCLARQVAQAHG